MAARTTKARPQARHHHRRARRAIPGSSTRFRLSRGAAAARVASNRTAPRSRRVARDRLDAADPDGLAPSHDLRRWRRGVSRRARSRGASAHPGFRSATSSCAPTTLRRARRCRTSWRARTCRARALCSATTACARSRSRAARAGLLARRGARLSREHHSHRAARHGADRLSRRVARVQGSLGRAVFTFGIALFVVFLVLAAQFESFVHPLVIMVTVPLAVAGGLLGCGCPARRSTSTARSASSCSSASRPRTAC